MAHECEICGEYCYCDMDDCGGMEQPDDCPHFKRHDAEEIADAYEDAEF